MGEELVAGFEFVAQTANDLEFQVGDRIIVTNKDTGDEGWWEGYLKGDPGCKVGFFPSNYAAPVTDAASSPPAAAAAAASAAATDDMLSPDEAQQLEEALELLDSDLGDGPSAKRKTTGGPRPPLRKPLVAPKTYTTASLTDEDFGELNDLVGMDTSPPPSSSSPVVLAVAAEEQAAHTKAAVEPETEPEPETETETETEEAAAGEDSNGDGDADANVAESAAETAASASTPLVPSATVSGATVYISPDYTWMANEPYFEIEVDVESQRGSKFGGLKKFTSYQIRTPAKGWLVSHRYKHFDWLRERLVAKYTGVAIPEIPSKQLTGRFKDNLVSYRRHFLAVFLNRIARHPLLRSAPVFLHFLSVDSSSEGRVWKQGKRAAEKDAFQGREFFQTIEPSSLPSLSTGEEVDQAQDFARAMPAHAKHWSTLVDMMNASAKKRMDLVSTTENLWQGFSQLSGSTGDPFCWRAACPDCQSAVECFGEVANTLRSLAETQLEASLAESDLANCFQSARDALGVTIAAIKAEVAARTALVAKTAKQQASSQPVADDALDLAKRHLAVSIAELNHFHQVRAIDIKIALLDYAKSQRELHSHAADVWANLHTSLAAFPVSQTQYAQELTASARLREKQKTASPAAVQTSSSS